MLCAMRHATKVICIRVDASVLAHTSSPFFHGRYLNEPPFSALEVLTTETRPVHLVYVSSLKVDLMVPPLATIRPPSQPQVSSTPPLGSDTSRVSLP
jgi:hypothetical protein